MQNLRKLVREVIVETRAVSDQVVKIVDKLIIELKNNIEKNKEYIRNADHKDYIETRFRNNEDIISGIIVNNIFVDVIFYKNKDTFEKNQVGGSFNPNNVKYRKRIHILGKNRE